MAAVEFQEIGWKDARPLEILDSELACCHFHPIFWAKQVTKLTQVQG